MLSTGAVFWVDPNHVDANDNKDGTNPDSPLATVAAAQAKCQAYRGDTIAVMANSFWQYGNPVAGTNPLPIREAVVVTVPGVRIVGVCPSGAMGVYWEPPANNGVCITVRAMDVLIEGFGFWGTTYTGGTGIRAEWDPTNGLYGENLVVRHCAFAGDLDYGVALDYAWNCHVHDNDFQGIGIAAIFNISVAGDPAFTTIRHNQFVNCVAAIKMPEAGRSVIVDNYILGDPAAALSYIDLTSVAANLNLVADNWLASTLAQYTGGNCGDSASDVWVRNHCQDGETIANP